MPGKGGRRLVIDADVARSAGETEHPVSTSCRGFLETATRFRHRVVMTTEIQEEWREHASHFARRWLVRMYARRLVDRTALARDNPLRRRVAAVLPNAGDLHLLEAAIVVESRTGPLGGDQLDALIERAEIEVVPISAEQATIARRAWRRFGKGRHAAGLNLGDCLAYALAESTREPLLFKGDDFARTDIEPA